MSLLYKLERAKTKMASSTDKHRCVGIVGYNGRQTNTTFNETVFDNMLGVTPYPNPDWLEGYEAKSEKCIRCVMYSDIDPEFKGYDGQAPGYKKNNTGHTPSWTKNIYNIGTVVVYTMGFKPCPAPSYKGSNPEKIRIAYNITVIR